MVEDYSRRLRGWLQSVGLSQDPFATYQAELESDNLAGCFVNRAYLHEVLGDPRHPCTAFLLAGRGCGKTATRLMVEYECQRQFPARVLVVNYVDFDFVLDRVGRDPHRVSIRDHMVAILRAALRSLAGHEALLARVLALPEVSRSLVAAYVRAFADPHTALALSAIGTAPPMAELGQAAPAELLDGFQKLARQAGIEGILILIDGVDQVPETLGEDGRENAIALVRPLVTRQALLSMGGVGFKFFLGTEMADAVFRDLKRTDRVAISTVRWNHDTLTAILKRRLQYFSDYSLQDLGELCDSRIRRTITERLVNWAEGSPRTLLRLCHTIVHNHARYVGPDRTLIRRSEVIQAIEEMNDLLKKERGYQAVGEAKIEEGQTPDEGLYLDNAGRVWIDGVELEKPLTPLEHCLLEALYRDRGQIVGTDELIRRVWGLDVRTWTEKEVEARVAAEETRLRKLVARLRKAVEPDPARARYIVNVRGRGYRLDDAIGVGH